MPVVIPGALSSPLPLLVAAAALLGAIVGSFLGAALERLPRGISIVTGRSACDCCGKALTVGELVPVLSWLAQRGRCRGCGEEIGWWQLGCELGAAAIGATSAVAGGGLAAMLLGWQLLLLALLDLRHLWLPRMLTAALALSGLVVAAGRSWRDGSADGLLWALAGGAAGFGVLWLIAWAYRRTRGREGMGGGDPPLLGAIGLWVGPAGVVHVLLGASVFGLFLAIAMHFAGRKIAADTALPLGTCLAATAWPVFLLQGLG